MIQDSIILSFRRQLLQDVIQAQQVEERANALSGYQKTLEKEQEQDEL